MGVRGLPAPPAPAGVQCAVAIAGPFAEVRLAQDDRAGIAQPAGDEGIAGRGLSHHGQRSRRGLHPVAGVDVVLEEQRDAVQRTARLAARALRIELLGDGQRIGIELDDGVEGGPALVEHVDALQQVGHHVPRSGALRRLLGEARDVGVLDAFERGWDHGGADRCDRHHGFDAGAIGRRRRRRGERRDPGAIPTAARPEHEAAEQHATDPRGRHDAARTNIILHFHSLWIVGKRGEGRGTRRRPQGLQFASVAGGITGAMVPGPMAAGRMRVLPPSPPPQALSTRQRSSAHARRARIADWIGMRTPCVWNGTPALRPRAARAGRAAAHPWPAPRGRPRRAARPCPSG